MADNTLTRGQREALNDLSAIDDRILNQRPQVSPVMGVDNISGLDRQKLDHELSKPFTTEEDAKATIMLHIAEQMDVKPDTITDDVAIKEYFGIGKDDSYDVKSLYEVLNGVAKTRVEPDEYDLYQNLSDEDKYNEAVSNLFDTEEGVEVEAQGEKSKARAVEIYNRQLLSKSRKHWLKYIDKELADQKEPSRMRNFATRSLMRGEINMVEYNSLSVKDKAFLADYLMVANPERAVTMLENVGISFKEGFHNISSSLEKTAEMTMQDAGYQSFSSKYAYAMLSSMEPEWEKLFDSKGKFKNDADRERIGRMIGEQRFRSWLSSQVVGRDSAEAFASGMSDLFDTIAGNETKNEKMKSFYISDTMQKMDNLYTQARAGKMIIDEQKEAFRVRNAVRKRYDRGEGAIGAVNNTVARVIPMAMDLGAVAVLGRANPGLALGYSAARFQGDFAEQLEFRYGFSEGESRSWAVMASVPYALVETLQGKQVAEGAALGFRAVFSKTYRKAIEKSLPQVMKSVGKDYAKDTIAEIGEEAIQKAIEIAVIDSLNQIEKTGDVDERELISDFKDEMVEAIKGMPFLTGGARVAGAGVALSADRFASDSFSGMMDRWTADVIEDKVRGQALETRLQAEDEIRKISSEDAVLYYRTKNTQDRLNILDDAGVSNPEAVDTILQGDPGRIVDMELSGELIRSGVASDISIEQREQSLADLQELMQREGFTEEQVVSITNAIDDMQVGRIDKAARMIETLEDLTTQDRIDTLRHERAHLLAEDMAEITPQEKTILDKAMPKMVSELEAAGVKDTDKIYAMYNGDAKSREVVADAIAVLNPQERTLFQKVGDFIGRMINFVKGDGFKTFRSVLKDIETRGSKRAIETAQQKGKTDVQEESQGRVRDQETQEENVRFARRVRDKKALTLDDAATRYALARIDGRDAFKVAESIAKDTGLDTQAIVNAGLRKVQQSEMRLEEGATRVEKRIAILKESARRQIRQEIRKAREEGIKAYKKAEQAKKRIKRVKQADINQQNKLRKAAGKESDAKVLKAIMTGDSKEFLNDMAEMAAQFIADNNITDTDVQNSIIKHTISNSLWDVISRMPQGRTRSHLNRMHETIKADKTSLNRARELTKDMIKRLHRIDTIAKQDNLVERFNKLLKTGVGRKVGDRALMSEKTISSDDAIIFGIIGNLFNKTTESTVDMMDWFDEIDLNTYDSDKAEGYVRKIEAFLPQIKKIDLDPMQKLAFAKTMLNDWGNLSGGSLQQIADAIVALEDMIGEAKNAQLEAARKQTNTARKAVGYARIGTENKSKKKALITGSPWFNEISMRIRELGNFASNRGKEALEKTIRMLKFQEASDKYNQVMRKGQGKFLDALKRNYSFKFVDAQIIKLNSKKKEYAELNPKGDALSKSQLMQIVGMYRQDEYRSNMRKMGFNDELMAKIEGKLTDADQAFMRDLYDIYQEIGTELNEVSQRLWGVDIANTNPFYLPVTVDLASEWTGVDMRTVPVAPPSLNERKYHEKELDYEAGITDMWDTRIAESAKFIAYAESNALAKAVFSDEKVVRNVEYTYGKSGVWTGVKNHLNSVYGNGGGDKFKSKTWRSVFNFLSHRALSGNLKLPFTQLTSAPAYALHYGSLKFARMTGRGLFGGESYVQAISDIWNSEQFKDRIALGGTEFMENALRERFGVSSFDKIPAEQLRDSAKFFGSLIKRMAQYGMLTNKAGDVAPILMLAPAIYIEESQHSATKEEAMTRTWEVINNTQQSFAEKNRSALSRNGGVLGKALSMFTTTPGQYMAYESQAVRRLTAKLQQDGVAGLKSKEMVKLMDTLFINHILLPGMFHTVSTVISNFMYGDDWDDDDTNGLIIAMITGPFAALAVFAGLTEDFLTKAIDGKINAFGGILPLDSLRKDARLFGEIFNHARNRDFGDMLESVDEELQNIVTPYRQIKTTLENN